MADQTYTAVTAASGKCTATVRTERRLTYLISQVSNEMLSAPVGCTCTLRKNGYLISVMIAAADTAAGDPPVLILPSDVLTVEWVGATPGALGKVMIFYEVVP